MKANEAPEKIYLQDSMSTDTIGDLWPEWFDAKVSDNSIEYTRTDAFIRKACEYFRTKKKCVFACIGEDMYHSLLNEEEIEDFKNYMKGE